MDKELIERLAREAGMDPPGGVFPRWGADDAALHRFAASVVEECAKVADNITYGDPGSAGVEQGIARDIRAMLKGPA